MTNIDEKLNGILMDVSRYGTDQTVINGIKQAFIDDGYRKEVDLGVGGYIDANHNLHDVSFENIKAEPTFTESQWQKKAIEDGWISPATGETHIHVCGCGKKKMTDLMTGQEWYDALRKELPATIKLVELASINYGTMRDAVIEAAKRASGLEVDHE